MNILVISTRIALPPRDGVTIPLAGYLLAFSQTYRVDYLYLRDSKKEPENSLLTADSVTKFWCVPIKRKSRVNAIGMELLGRSPYYGAWSLADTLPDDLNLQDYDIIWVGDAPAIGLWARGNYMKGVNNKHIAAISDIHSCVIAHQAKNISKSSIAISTMVDWFKMRLRVNRLKASESNMLGKYDGVQVQTPREIEWARRMLKREWGNTNFIDIANGVERRLLDIPLSRPQNTIVFIAILNGVYGERLRWFIDQVWRKVKRLRPGVKFSVIGKGASSELKELMHNNSVSYTDFVDDLCDVYRPYSILVAPIFKGYGLINKVIEAMAAGTVVVGDKTAFNGLTFFADRTHGVVADTSAQFVQAILSVLDDDSLASLIRYEARIAAKEHFSWKAKADKAIKWIEHLP